MKALKQLTFLLLLFVLGQGSTFAQEVNASLQNESIRIGEQTTIKLEVSFPIGTSTVMLPNLKDTLTKEITVVEVSEVDTIFDESDVQTKIYSQSITITSWDSGYHVIPPFVFLVGTDSLKTKPLLLEVNTISISPDQDIKDIKSIIEVPFSLWDWILVHRIQIGLILLLIALIIAAYYVINYYRNKKLNEVAVVPKEAADLVALRKLKELEAQKLWQNNKVKEYHSNLSFILREYIKNRFEFNALELPSDELLMILSLKLKDEKKMHELIRETLFIADMTKYAKQQPLASENEAVMKNAIHFIEKTAYKEEINTDDEVLNEEDESKIGDKNA